MGSLETKIERLARKIFAAKSGGIGTVVGVTRRQQRWIFALGSVSENSVFEIASITKVFTSLLLADLVGEGRVSLSDPVERYLPSSVIPPVHLDGSPLTLEQLATHRSGLPRLPTNLGTSADNPYSQFGASQLYDYLSGARVPIGGSYDYSNLGAGLLGHILSQEVLGLSFDDAVRSRICSRLHLEHTGTKTEPLVQGYTAEELPTCPWDWLALAGAGSLRSSAAEILMLLEAEMGLIDTSLQRAIALTLSTRHRRDGGQIALGWHIQGAPGADEEVLHNGGTYGFSSFCAFNQSRQIGVVVLRNTGSALATDGGLKIFEQLMAHA